MYTGRFIMFSVITNIYNKKTKGPTLMELFTAIEKLKFFLTTRDVRCVHHGWHGTHRCDIQVLAAHSSTWVHRYSSLLQWSMPLGQRGHMAIVGHTSTFRWLRQVREFPYHTRGTLVHLIWLLLCSYCTVCLNIGMFLCSLDDWLKNCLTHVCTYF
jgi:hypothetical protein